jgi:hypothetical protein
VTFTFYLCLERRKYAHEVTSPAVSTYNLVSHRFRILNNFPNLKKLGRNTSSMPVVDTATPVFNFPRSALTVWRKGEFMGIGTLTVKFWN